MGTHFKNHILIYLINQNIQSVSFYEDGVYLRNISSMNNHNVKTIRCWAALDIKVNDCLVFCL